MILAMMPHGSCFLWNPALTGLHFTSDVITALSYLSIPAMLIAERHQMNREARAISVLFALFILSCGFGHLITAWNIWHASYWLEGGIKLFTAGVSTYTAIYLYRQIPVFFGLHKRLELSEEILLTDALTRLPNRRAFLNSLVSLIDSIGNRGQDTPSRHALMLADLDGFKSINDRFGHPIGDQVLREIAILLKALTHKENIFVARLGGDEFAIIIRHYNQENIQEKVLETAQTLRSTLQDYAASHEYAAGLGISLGFCLFGEDTEAVTIEELYTTADRALYHAKGEGKGGIAWIKPSSRGQQTEKFGRI